MELRRAVCFCLLTLAACGGDQVSEAEPVEGDDAAVVDTADSSALAPVVGDAGAAATPWQPSAKDGAVDAYVAPVAAPDAASDASTQASTPIVADASVEHDASAPRPSCAGTVYYADKDGDGFGDPTSWLCDQRLNSVTNANDCYDHNAKAHPGATDFQPVDRGDGNFDYDCDGTAEQQSTAMASCKPYPDKIGWLGGAVPDCGMIGTWFFADHTTPDLDTCAANKQLVQSCR